MYRNGLVTILLALGVSASPALSAHGAALVALRRQPTAAPRILQARVSRPATLERAPHAEARSVTTPITPCTWQVEPSFHFADTAAHYWLAVVQAQPSVTLTVTGAYPGARYASLQLYRTTTGSYLTGVTDQDFPPDPGAANPFVDGTARGVMTDTYTLRVAFHAPPPQPAPRTLYVNVPAGTYVTLTYRLFLPDAAAGATGNVPLPRVRAAWIAGIPIPCPQWIAPISPTPGPLPAPPPAAPTPLAFIRVTGQQLGGYGNGDAAYLYTVLPPAPRLYVVRFIPPTTPRTLAGGPLDPNTQLRYWSLCAYTGTAVARTCLADERVPRDAYGRASVVFGPWWARPTNATAANGVTFVSLGWFTMPDYLLLRQILPAATFGQSAFAVPLGATPDATTMGAYAPSLTICTTTQFEQNSCGT